MTIVIRMPEVLAGATEGVISRWSVAEGDEVKVGDVLAEIETDKASVEYQAEDAGIVARLLAAEGDMIDVGRPIAVFASAGDTESDIAQALANAGVDGENTLVATALEEVAEPSPASEQASPTEVSAPGVPDVGGRLRASPIVRKIAKEQGVDLSAVAGSGPSGRMIARTKGTQCATFSPSSSSACDNTRRPVSTTMPTTRSLPFGA